MTSTLRNLLDRSLNVKVQEFREAVESLFEGVFFDHFHYTNSMNERVKIDRIVLPQDYEDNKDKIYVLLNQLKRVDLTATPTEVIFFIKEELICDTSCGNFDYNIDYKWRDVLPHQEDVEEEQMTYMVKYGECGIDKRYGRKSTITSKFKITFNKISDTNWNLFIFVDDKLVREQFVMSTNVRYAITKGFRILRNVLEYTYFESIQDDYKELRGIN